MAQIYRVLDEDDGRHIVVANDESEARDLASKYGDVGDFDFGRNPPVSLIGYTELAAPGVQSGETEESLKDK